LDPEDALDIARANRLDWMNNRADLVDQWRLIQFNADRLQAVLNVTLSGDISTTGDNPLRFRAPTGNLRAGLQFDGPFTRLVERNTFRQSVIQYQRDRRRLLQYEDAVYQTLRQVLRDLDEHRVNLEIQRRAVMIAIRRVDQTRETLNTPPPPPKPGEPTTSLGPTAAFDLLTALNDLLSSQNNFMSVWLNYYAARMRLARELGTMQLDERGIWLDVPLEDADRLRADEAPLPPDVPDSLFKALDNDLPARQPAPATAPAPLPPARDPAIRPKETPEPATKPRSALPGSNDRKSAGGVWQKKDTRSGVKP
jgi:outer membrane protein TolC